MEMKEYWIWISRIKGIGVRTINKLLKKYHSPKEIWNLSKQELMQNRGIGEKIAEQILNPDYRIDIPRYISYMEKYQIGILTIQDLEYPENLRNIYDPPIILYYRGNISLLKENGIAMIGTRQYSQYGMKMALQFSFELAKHNIAIISGLAKGIDCFSHIGCLKAGGKTIAVLGSGVDQIYPKENKSLYEQILKQNGLILSEYIIGTKPDKMNFPARNRIISALSNGVFVIEAKKKSGTLITVDFALEQGKEVFVLPGNIDEETSKGTNDLLKEGAKCVTCVEDILRESLKFS